MKRALIILLTLSLLLLPALLYADGGPYFPKMKAGQTGIACYAGDITSTDEANKTVIVKRYDTKKKTVKGKLKIVFAASTKAYKVQFGFMEPDKFTQVDLNLADLTKKGTEFTLVGKMQGKSAFKAQAVYYP